jgi:RNA polymerase sigma-70 factor (ECF subfamily)
MRSEEELWELARRFDEQALAEVYDRYSPGIFRFAIRLLGDKDLAEECVAETFARFLQALKQGDGAQKHLRAYLYRIAHNWITDYYRRSPSWVALEQVEHPDQGQDPPQAFAEEMERREVRLALARLTPDQRQVIVLKYLEDWETQDIARVLNKPVGAIKALQHRGLAALRRCFSEKR